MTKRRKVLAMTAAAGLPLIGGCVGDCEIHRGQIYHTDDGTVEILDSGDTWLDVDVEDEVISGEYHLRKLGCDDRYCRYELDSAVPLKLRFDCPDNTADFYV